MSWPASSRVLASRSSLPRAVSTAASTSAIAAPPRCGSGTPPSCPWRTTSESEAHPSVEHPHSEPAGLGVALVPALAASSVRPDIALLPVRDEDAPARAVYAATERGRSLTPAAEAFVTALREAAAEIRRGMA
ncbi:LysR substrate-binding domain-containing protein [Streptomyces sp. NPDC060000]|uniref:LysR substrate-binding domain-containing protein n=1 Tax=Streptomyces sp. NPDC060000 TaxID=3347031 RepID=UPI003695FA9B